jgi:hypothetical protein
MEGYTLDEYYEEGSPLIPFAPKANTESFGDINIGESPPNNGASNDFLIDESSSNVNKDTLPSITNHNNDVNNGSNKEKSNNTESVPSNKISPREPDKGNKPQQMNPYRSTTVTGSSKTKSIKYSISGAPAGNNSGRNDAGKMTQDSGSSRSPSAGKSAGGRRRNDANTSADAQKDDNKDKKVSNNDKSNNSNKGNVSFIPQKPAQNNNKKSSNAPSRKVVSSSGKDANNRKDVTEDPSTTSAINEVNLIHECTQLAALISESSINEALQHIVGEKL